MNLTRVAPTGDDRTSAGAPPTAIHAPAEPGRTVGESGGDAAVTARVKTALMQADDVKGLSINVDNSERRRHSERQC
jgi:hypothetical protein